MTKQTIDHDVYAVVESTIYSAYSLILEQLLTLDDGEELAETWLRLTALGMKYDPAALAHRIHDYNQVRLTHIQEGRANA